MKVSPEETLFQHGNINDISLPGDKSNVISGFTSNSFHIKLMPWVGMRCAFLKVASKMDREKTKILIFILKDSSLYETLPHEEKISLLLRLEDDYSFLFHADVHEGNEKLKTL